MKELRERNINEFTAIRISLASPEQIRSWSFGEVTKPETINYRTFKPERDGLFCAKIFGPVTDWECLCGKYKRLKHRNIVCDKCGVEVIQSKVRRERMGHIELASPVSHIWFLKGLPSRIGQVLDMKLKDLESILYFESFVVTEPGDAPLESKQLLSEDQCRQLKQEYGDAFVAKMGAEAIQDLLRQIDLEDLCDDLRERMRTETSQQRKVKHSKRLKVLDGFRQATINPDWMIMEVIPVLPPELRPLVPLDGGRFATSDLNDLYRRVINRNNRLKRLVELRAPEVIIRNEKRILQEAVDALFDNGRRGRVLRGSNNRPLKSLSDTLKGKQGRFRQNLLGKRVDYSGRSVIVVGPELKFYECGLPKKMALELFKPFIYNKLEERGFAATIKAAKEMVEAATDEVWDVLEEVIQDHLVMLNRAPTLHRLGIQAFRPKLVEGKAIRIHPFVCFAFNADFDGDQMAVHVPLSPKAQTEAHTLLLSSRNILSPANGKPVVFPTQDVVLGLYYLTRERQHQPGAGMVFGDVSDVLHAYHSGVVNLHSPIRFRWSGTLMDLTKGYEGQSLFTAEVTEVNQAFIETTVGRVLFNDALPASFPFINGLMGKRGSSELIGYSYRNFGTAMTVELIDTLKDLGFSYATKAGFTFALDDMIVPADKDNLVRTARRQVMEIEDQYLDGLITAGERYNRILHTWSEVTDRVTDEMFREMETTDTEGEELNSIYVMAVSGARGGKDQIRQLAGMRGLMAKPSGEVIETPITANFREGLTVLQYFISTHGARKGLADTALKTADSGYMTRRLVDVAQDVVISMEDCGALDGAEVEDIVEGGEVIVPLRNRIVGRFSFAQVRDPITNKQIVAKNGEITEDVADGVVAAGLERIRVRSILTCEAESGICAKCYGWNLAEAKPVEVGEAVGIMAAQSIGEPGTQLTMRTFHIGGTASGVAEASKLEAKHEGAVKFVDLKTVRDRNGDLVVVNRKGSLVVQDEEGREREHHQLVYGASLKVKDGAPVTKRQLLVEWDPFSRVILTEVSGAVEFKDVIEGLTMREEVDEITGLSMKVIVDCKDEQLQPELLVKDKKGKLVRKYLLPTDAHLSVEDGSQATQGDILAKIPRDTAKTKDITGGLPRVVELFEARKPKNAATISEIDGVVNFGKIVRGNRKLIVKSPTEEEREYSVPRGLPLNVQEGDEVLAGEPLVDAPINPHDILAVLGEKALQDFLVREIQAVYRLQGVEINDRHIEAIVRQMMRWIKVEEVGDSPFAIGEQVDKFKFQRINAELTAAKKEPAVGKPMLLGITKASLSTDSFISAASFQETTRVLTEAAINGSVDFLRGLKENVIMGRLIPAGTGLARYRNVQVEEDPTVRKAPEEEFAESLLRKVGLEDELAAAAAAKLLDREVTETS